MVPDRGRQGGPIQGGKLAVSEEPAAVHHDVLHVGGPGRIDLFWGAGDKAETEASSMKAPGDLYILIAK